MVAEVIVTIQDDESKLTKKYLIYDDFMASDTDPIIIDCIKSTQDSFDGEPDDISVSIKLEIV